MKLRLKLELTAYRQGWDEHVHLSGTGWVVFETEGDLVRSCSAVGAGTDVGVGVDVVDVGVDMSAGVAAVGILTGLLAAEPNRRISLPVCFQGNVLPILLVTNRLKGRDSR